ncbi:uncharacterized protein LOC116941536 isoform X1 [Petromyzon marinus]|uniref:Opioid growth factor receptor-like protein 1 isoform X2 n=2 Tax=Petromyzon marinus TaxID=7757 RepID=A0AAJ7T1U6_PETMA|nr:opioid growth factor receptor-like protein 1 isoform X2 [Petromyzon marinus]
MGKRKADLGRALRARLKARMERSSGYDSTWDTSDEDEAAQQTDSRPKKAERTLCGRSVFAAKDLQRYRRNYPGTQDDIPAGRMMNYKFYLNQLRCKPGSMLIEEILTDWFSDYEQLEWNHSYIQWLFPIREQGMNPYAAVLTKEEIEKFKESKEVQGRLMRAYRMMLDFYGIMLVNEETGEVARTGNWRTRFLNLNSHTHNNLRLTRILKSLGELGLERMKAPLVRFFLEETLCNKQLPRVKQSCLEYFVFTLRTKKERRELLLFARKHYPQPDDFPWGPPTHKLPGFRKPAAEQQQEQQQCVAAPESGGNGSSEQKEQKHDIGASSEMDESHDDRKMDGDEGKSSPLGDDPRPDPARPAEWSDGPHVATASSSTCAAHKAERTKTDAATSTEEEGEYRSVLTGAWRCDKTVTPWRGEGAATAVIASPAPDGTATAGKLRAVVVSHTTRLQEVSSGAEKGSPRSSGRMGSALHAARSPAEKSV